MNLIIILGFIFFTHFQCSESNTSKNIQSNNKQKSSYHVEEVVRGLYVPWSIIFTDSVRCLVNERDGKIRVINNNVLQKEPLKVFSDISTGAEEGLMGLATEPDYVTNKFLYISYAYESNGDLYVKVIRVKDNGSSVTDDKILLDKIPATHLHAGCRLRFGPDKKLYITTGDATNRELPQNLKSLGGKILRINPDGSIPSDNPYGGSPVWSFGHRNPQGIDWYPGLDILYETEHGPSGFDGPGGGDEVNIIYKGKNYGWPLVHHKDHMDGMEDPVLEFTPALAPASGMFYRSGVIKDFKNNFFFGCLRGETIIRVIIDEKDPAKVLSFEKLDVNYGRIRDVTEAPDGSIWFSTSNRDGRGRVNDGDDKIYRIVGN